MKIRCEVAYALPERQYLVGLEVVNGCTLFEAIQQSGILTHFPEMDLHQQAIGVFSKRRLLTDIVQEGDRIEIYRPLRVNPREARRERVRK